MPRHRILIVEDDRPFRDGLARLVEILGHEPITAATVAEAMGRLAEKPTIVLLDVRLADGSGTQVLRRIRESGLPTRVAMITGLEQSDLEDEERELADESDESDDAQDPPPPPKADAFFKKPPKWDRVMEWIGS